MHSVKERRLVQLHERVGVLPVSSGDMASVNDGDVNVGVVDKRIGERHAHRPSPDDEVVSLSRLSRHWSPNPGVCRSYGFLDLSVEPYLE